MTISDLLTLIAILLAIIAFISEKNREYLFLKLSYIDLAVITVSFIYVHFLISYDWWASKFSWLSLFEFEGSPSTGAWAYILSLATLAWSIYCVFFRQFPLSRRVKLMAYYKQLILRNDIAFLAQLIETYHSKQIIDFLQTKKNIRIENVTGNWQIDNQAYLRKFDEVMTTKSLLYGNNIFNQIILNDTFIDNVANINPYLFSNIISELNVIRLKNDDFINRYLKILTLEKNSSFFREVRNNQNLGVHNAYAIDEGRPILFSLFNDINVCSINNAWRGIGEQAILEILEEAKKDFSPLREYDREQDNDTVWSYRITIAIWYFDIMVRQAIVQNVNDHMWMFYYQYFVRMILLNMKDLPFADSEQNRHSRNFDLIESIFSKMTDWKAVLIDSQNTHLLQSIHDCVGLCIYEITISNKLRAEDKNLLINSVWVDLIETIVEVDEGDVLTNEIITVGMQMFKKPTVLFPTRLGELSEENQAYVDSLNYLWINRDIPRLDGEYGRRANRFKIEVIDPMNPPPPPE